MFRAVLEILYAGVGASLNAGACPIDPNVVVLKGCVSSVLAIINNNRSLNYRANDDEYLHIHDFLELTLSQQRQKCSSDVMHCFNVCL